MLYGSVGELIDKQLPPMSHAQALIGARGVVKDLNRVGITSIQDMARVEEVSRQQLYHAHIERSFTDTRIFRTFAIAASSPCASTRSCPCARGPGSRRRASSRVPATHGFPTARSRTSPTAASCSSPIRTTRATAALDFPDGERALRGEADRRIGSRRVRHDDARDRRPGAAPHARLVRGGDQGERPAPRPAQRIIHVWYAQPEDLARAGRLGLVADVQPAALLENYESVARAIGPERSRWASAYRTMIDNGVRSS
jgi:hypothetical protein